MLRITFRSVLAFVPVILVLASLPLEVSSQSANQPSVNNGEWPHYGADLKNSRYSPLDQINASNFKKLEVAWRFKTDSLGPRPEYKLEGTPLMIKGMLYSTAGTRRSVVALDARTGELMWVYGVREGQRATSTPRQLSGRGLAYWTDGKGDERILYMTIGYRLVALNAGTGQPIGSFGTNGMVDLKEGVVYGTGQQIDLETGEIGIHATPVVAKDVILIGSAFQGGMTPKTHNYSKGLARAFDVRTGKKLWQFNTIPRPGEFGNNTWENDSWAVNGNTGIWAQISVDEDLGLVYLPVEDPTSDIYGGHRPGDNLFGGSLVCVDLKTGQRKWHFQLVHHPIWDTDIPAPPILADITVNGKNIKAIAQSTKQGFLYVFDRLTGQPVWPIEERPVPQSEVPGEKTSPTQPHPTKPPAYGRIYLKVPDDLIDFTPELRAQALENLKRYKNGPLFNPPIVGDVNGVLGAINMATGVSNWPGASFDPETHIVYVAASNASVGAFSVAPPPAGYSDIRYIEGVIGRQFVVRPGQGAPAPSAGEAPPDTGSGLRVQGLPIVKPPYGLLSAINLDRGDFLWQVPHGDTPDVVRNHPALKGINISKTGQNGSVGSIVTKTLVIVGDSQITAPPGRARGAMLRAYDKVTGNEVGAVWMPAPQSGSPMTYMVEDKQYIVVAISGGNYSGEYLAFSLPSAEMPSPFAQSCTALDIF